MFNFALVVVSGEGPPFPKPQPEESGLEPVVATRSMVPSFFYCIRGVCGNPDGGPQGTPPGQEANAFWLQERESLPEEVRESRFCSRKECRPRHSQRKPEKQQMGE